MLSSRIINREISVEPFSRRKTNWILSAVGAAAGLASSLFGHHKAKKKEKQAQQEQEKRERSEQAWYDRRYNEDYMDTAAGQNLLRQANYYADKTWKKAEGAKAVGGGTDAATAQAKESANNMMGNTIAKIAAQDTERKDRVDDTHQQNLQNFSRQTQARYENQAQNITQASQNASNAMFSMGMALDSAGAKPSAPSSVSGNTNPAQWDNTFAKSIAENAKAPTNLKGQSSPTIGGDLSDPSVIGRLYGRSAFGN